jgi:hypothetical protein
MHSEWDQNEPGVGGFAKPIRPYCRAKASHHRFIFIPPHGGAAAFGHLFGLRLPKLDGLVHAKACDLSESISRPERIFTVHTA